VGPYILQKDADHLWKIYEQVYPLAKLVDANAALWELRGLHSTILDETKLEARKLPLEGKDPAPVGEMSWQLTRAVAIESVMTNAWFSPDERVMLLKVAGELRRRAVERKPELATYVSIKRDPTKPETRQGLIEKMGAEGLQYIRGSTRVQGP
jgi:hypothetical protein